MSPDMIRGLIALLRGKSSPGFVAAGFAVGAILGLIPKGNLLGVFFFLLFFLTQIDKAVALISTLLFTPLGYLLDPLAHRVGRYLLADVAALKPVWTALYNLPIIPWTHFNNTVVLGQLVLGLLIFIPLFIAVRLAAVYYQKNVFARIQKLKIVQALSSLRVYKLYRKYRDYTE